MASFTGKQLSGAGTPIPALIAGNVYNFRLLTPQSLSGSGYFTMETVRDADGRYDSTKPTNAIGTYDFATGGNAIETPVTSSYIMSGDVTPTSDRTGSFIFTPTANIVAGSSMLRTTGGIGLELTSAAYTFTTKAELSTAVNLWISDNTAALATYGEINTWDVLAITNMDSLFLNKTTFNSNISNWNVTNVEVMASMFEGATAFNQPIGSWNVQQNGSAVSMFNGATSFNQPLNNWDVSNVGNFLNMFANADAFQQPLNLWEPNSLGNGFGQGFMGATGTSTAITYNSLDTLYNGWVVDFAALQSNVTISFGDSTFTSAGLAAKNILVNSKNWTITDGGQI